MNEISNIIQYIGQHSKGIAAVGIAIVGYGGVFYAIYKQYQSEKRLRDTIIQNIRSRKKVICLDDIKQE